MKSEKSKQQTYEEFVARIIVRGNGNPKGLDAIKNALENGRVGK